MFNIRFNYYLYIIAAYIISFRESKFEMLQRRIKLTLCSLILENKFINTDKGNT